MTALVRRLLPPPSGAGADAVDLDEAYAAPAGPRHVRANMVVSADGAVALGGSSCGLSGRADRRVLSVLRGLADVILVGAATVLAEGYRAAAPSPPRQARRRAAGMTERPRVAVVSRDLDLAAELLRLAHPAARPLVITCAQSPRQRRVAVAELADVVVVGQDRVELAPAVDALAELGLRRVLCEGGPQLLAQLVAAGRLDELCLTVSPLLVPGGAPRLLAGPAAGQPWPLRLAQVLEEDGFLFLRYLVADARGEPSEGAQRT